jgi:hypothetical protein
VLSVIKTCSSWTSWPLNCYQSVIPKHQNAITTLRFVLSQKTAGLVTCTISVSPTIRRMSNGGIQMRSVISQKTLSSRIKPQDFPGIGPALPNQNLCSRFRSPFIHKDRYIWDFQLLILHKQNPQTKINQPAVTAKIISQPAIQLCVASVAVQSWQTDFHWMHERPPRLVQHSGLIWTNIMIGGKLASWLWGYHPVCT